MNPIPEPSLSIATPDGVDFRLRLAGPLVRATAYAIDLAIISFLTYLVGIFAPILAITLGADWMLGFTILAGFLIQTTYGIILEGLWHGRTVGKRILGLRVADDRGLRLRFSQVVVRNLLRVIDSLPAFYLVGGTTALLNRRAQRLGDLAAGTVVIRTATPESPEPPARASGKSRHNPWLRRPDLAARLRHLTDPALTQLLLHLLQRRDTLHPEARLALHREFLDHFNSLLHLPEDSLLGLTDEQRLQDIAEALTHRPTILTPPPIG